MSTKSKKNKASRRSFLMKSSIGVGMMVGITMVSCGPLRRFVAATSDEIDLEYDNKFGPRIWFQITPENELIFHSPKMEMGQGVFTGLAQLAAEELEVEVSRIKVVPASTLTGPIDQFSTGGSNSISGLWRPLRELSATMREMLKEQAAMLMGVSLSSLSISDGVISGGGKKMTYGEIVQQVKEWKEPKKVPNLKSAKDYKFIGKAIPRVDLTPKVMGEPIFGIDAQIEGMLYGAIVRPSMVDATFKSAKIDKAEKMPGVIKVVLEKDFVGVVAESKVEAELAKKALEVEWNVAKVWQQAEIEEMIKVGNGKAVEIQKEGKARGRLSEEGTIVAEFTSPIGAHAHLEPNGAIAHVEANKAKVIISTQVVKITQEEVADALGFKSEQVEIQPTFLGGGFGRRLHTPNAIQAALLSKAVGKPVHCFFDRKEEFQNDTFRPPTHHLLKAKLNETGQILALEHNVSSGDVAFGSPLVPGILETVAGADVGAWRGGMIQYRAIPHFRAVSWRVRLPFATSWWRSLGLLANTFAIESFMDELSIKAGKDPVQFRLDHIEDDERGTRLKGVIKAAAKKGDWGKDLPEGSAMGFACSTDVNTPVAQVVEVSVVNKQIKVHKVTCAIDPGVVVNPDGVRAQCEGAIIMGLSASLFEKMVIKDGTIVPTNYGSYPIAIMKHAPKEIDVVLLENGEKPRGVGEPPLGPIGAAIANAVFRITGQRLRAMPFELT